VFAVLPTGFGKSLIYQLAPMVDKKMGRNENPVVIVVSPLVTLMEDQVKEATEMGMSKLSLHQTMVRLCYTTRTPYPYW